MKKIIFILCTFLFLTAVLFSQVNSKFRMTLQVGNPGGVSKIVFSNDGTMFATSNIMNNTIKIWSAKAKLLKFINNDEDLSNCEMAFSSDNKYLAYTNFTSLKIYNLETGALTAIKGSSDVMSRTFFGVAFSKDNKTIFVGSSNSIATTLPLELGELEYKNNLKKLSNSEKEDLNKFYYYDETLHKYKMIFELPDHSILYAIFVKLGYNISAFVPSYSNCIEEWSFNGKFIKKIAEHNNIVGKMITKLLMSPDGKLLSAAYDGNIKLWDLEKGLVTTVQGSNDGTYYNFNFSSDGKLFGWATFAGIKICNQNGVYLINLNRNVYGCDINIDKKMITEYAYDSDGKGSSVTFVRNRNFKDEIISDLKEMKISGYTLKLNPQGTMAISGTMDGTVNIFSLKTKQMVSLVNEKSEWLSFTYDGYWDSSKNGGKLVSMVKDFDAYSVDQFASKYNRPDIILKRIEVESDEVIDHYLNQYKKRRLRKLNLKEEQLLDDLHIPEVKILETKIQEKTAQIRLSFSDTDFIIKSYNVFVNDVPLYGSYGKELNRKEVEFTENIELTTGLNKIEVSCLNEKGAESFRALTKAKYNEKTKSNLYFIGFGVSRYKDKSLNLQYADKDAKDLESVIKKMNNNYDEIFTKTYTNEEVTPENIKKAKDFLKTAKVDDTFILFIAGHGVHDNDKEATYYYLTYNTDIKNLSKSAANFELIEDLMQGINPRQKLFLMDTCESGDVDEDTKNTTVAMSGSRGLKSRALIRGMKVSKETKQLKRIYLLENDRYIYNDLVRRSGGIVFSSCKGGEFSYESDEIKNGLFTKELINTLTQSTEDNSVISIDELKDKVIKGVSASSSGKQNPTVDRDNIFIKFGLPVVK